MNCPFCLQINLYHKLILLPGIYVCENEKCYFCETPERFEELYSKSNLPVTNIKEKLYFPNSLKEIEENHGCNETENIMDENSDFMEFNKSNGNIVQNNSNFDDLFQQFENNCNYLINNSSNEIQQNNSLIDSCDEIINLNGRAKCFHEAPFNFPESVDEETKLKKATNLHIFNTVNDSKSKMIDKIISENFSFGFWSDSSRIFNWLIMPYYFKMEQKIVHTLLIHLDVLDLDDLKYEYSANEAFANNYNIKTLKHLSNGFLQKLFEMSDIIFNEEYFKKPTYEKVMCLLYKLFDKYDLTNQSKFQYTAEIFCSFCNSKSMNTRLESFLILKSNDIPFEIENNRFIYQTCCLKCQKKSYKTIQIQNVPQFVIAYCPNGLEESFFQYENKIISNDKRELVVIGVVEIQDIEGSFDQISFDNSNVDSGYCIHFRNTNGWYSINDDQDYLCSPCNMLSIDSLSSVRFVIFGTPPDPRRYQNDLFIQTFLNTHEDYICNLIRSCPKKSEFNVLCKKILNRKKSRKIKKKNYLEVDFIEPHKLLINPPNGEVALVDMDDNDYHCCNKSDIVFDCLSPPNQSDISFIKSSQYYSQTSNVHSQPYDHKLNSFSSTNTSSGVSSASSLFDNDIFSKPCTITSSQYRSQSISSVSNTNQLDKLKKKSYKRICSIDDLIDKQCKKLKSK